jgi:hypothetical protein
MLCHGPLSGRGLGAAAAGARRPARKRMLAWSVGTNRVVPWSTPMIVTELAGDVGEDWAFTFTASPAPAAGIAGWALVFSLRDPYRRTTLVTRSGADVTITDPAAGIFTVRMAAADTAGLPPGIYEWDVCRTDAGAKTVLGKGKFTLDWPAPG